MTLNYLVAITAFCDRKFEYIPGPESFDLRLDEVRKQLAITDRVKGGTGLFCAFVFWQLKRIGYSPTLWYVKDINGYEFFVINIFNYYISYYDGKIYVEDKCPWKPLKRSDNLKEWINVDRDTISDVVYIN